MEHLFTHCPMIWSLWTALVSVHGGDWVCPLLVKDLILGWICIPLRKKDSRLWKAAPLCLLWAIWKERNNVIFEDECFSFSRPKSFVLRSLFPLPTLIRGGGGGGGIAIL